MPRLPFNPESLLTLFMTKEKAGSLAGDLEERFHNIWLSDGWVAAMIWVCVEVAYSLPPLIIECFKTNESAPILSGGTSNNEGVVLAASSFAEQTAGECRTFLGCLGSIRWDVDAFDGCDSGYCEGCGAFHIRCGCCGEVSVQDSHESIQCSGCGSSWTESLDGFQRSLL